MENLSIENKEEGGAITRALLQEIERTRKDLSSVPEIIGHFEHGGSTIRVRKGNFADSLVANAQITVRAARHVLDGIQNGEMRSNVSREEYHREEIAAKIVSFYEGLEVVARAVAEAEDRRGDPEYLALAEHCEKMVPSLRQEREAFKQRS